MGAVNPTGAFDDRAGNYSRMAEEFEANARPDDVDDGINGADFMEMNLIWREAVNFAFGEGDAMKDGDGFCFYPVRKAA